MNDERRAPTRRQVTMAIARRELGIGARRRLVRMLFLASLIPPLILAGVLIARVMMKEMIGQDLGFDPLAWLLRIQVYPVALLALSLGTPAVARDRQEEVLYLYAVRPVTPSTYALGKYLAVAAPTVLLLWVPAVLIVGLRAGILGSMVPATETLLLLAKGSVASLAIGLGFAGVCLGPSALMRRSRWALLLALVLFGLIEPFKIFRGVDGIAIGPSGAAFDLLNVMFGDAELLLAFTGASALLLYGLAGFLLTRARVRREMIP